MTTATTEYRHFASVAPLPSNSVINRAAISFELEKWQLNAIKEIASLGRLPEDWDGYGSGPPTAAIREWACDFIGRTVLGILPPPEFHPESDGGLQIDWKSGHNRELELHLEQGQPVTYLKVEQGSPVDEGVFGLTDERKAEELLTWLRRG